MATVGKEFQSAPMGRRVVCTMIFVFSVIAAGAAVSIALVFNAPRMSASSRSVSVLVPLLMVFVAVPIFLYERSRITGFRLEEDCLVLGRKRYPLEGLVGIARDPEILRWAFRLCGNGGLGSIRGRYWSRRVGKFYAFLTDPEKAVVLRWPDKTVVVSPEDPEFFIYSVRSATGLK
jgi:hypothetical protein